ncbi:MAG: GntR family transcriptional regulator [Caldilinea sp.]|jgi:GntR family transcriptional regulator|uniref:GntR family transcriptional regulator n=1 Tax=Caldilinea sp. TaxID=2293560 RepID=UPI0030A09E52
MSFTINNYQIDHNSFVPYYAQIAQYLREQIKIGNLPPGSLLPSETELCNAFKVSRIVARQALQELEYEGLIYRQRGKGTFVAEPKVHEQLVQRLTGFHQDMVDQGHRVSNKVLRQEIISADGEIGRRLRLSPNDEVIAIERLRLVDEKAINLSVSYVPYHLCPDLLGSDLTKSSLYAFLETCVGRRIARGQRTIEAILPSSSIAQLLEIDTKLPVFRITNICYLDDGTPIEYSIGYHRSDRTLFEVQLIRNSEQTLPAGYTLVR